MEIEGGAWTICEECHGRGNKRHRLVKKVRLNYQKAFDQFERTKGEDMAPVRPKGNLYACLNCGGSGLVPSASFPVPDKENFPNVAIIGGGIGGVALAVAFLHRGIPFTIYERDSSFDARSPGYGFTLQQASKAIKGFGLLKLEQGIYYTCHLVHNTDGEVIAKWGMRISKPDSKVSAKRINVHIPRQSLRLALLEQLGGQDMVQWGHQLVDFKAGNGQEIDLSFQVNGVMKNAKADLVVGADGIRSSVRRLLFGEDDTPLRYLGYMVILGICSLERLEALNSPLLDSATVFQTVNGHERIYMMPYSLDSVMWQLSFPMSEEDAKVLSAKGSSALKEEACRRTRWHVPIPQILSETLEAQISGYLV